MGPRSSQGRRPFRLRPGTDEDHRCTREPYHRVDRCVALLPRHDEKHKHEKEPDCDNSYPSRNREHSRKGSRSSSYIGMQARRLMKWVPPERHPAALMPKFFPALRGGRRPVDSEDDRLTCDFLVMQHH